MSLLMSEKKPTCRQCGDKKTFNSILLISGEKVTFPIDCPDCQKEETKSP